MSSFFKRLGGLLLVRACYGAKRLDYGTKRLSLWLRVHRASVWELLLPWDLPGTANPKLRAVQTVQGAGGSKKRALRSVSTTPSLLRCRCAPNSWPFGTSEDA